MPVALLEYIGQRFGPRNYGVPQNGQPDRNEVMNMIENYVGHYQNRRIRRPMYRKPYLEWIDQHNEFPRGEERRSIVEHIGRFVIQCGELANNDLKFYSFLGRNGGEFSHAVLSDPNYEIDLVEIIGQKIIVYTALQRKDVEVPLPATTTAKRNPMEIGKKYTFDILRASDIFDNLLAGKYIKVLEGHKVPTKEPEHYYKWHGVKSHTTNNS
ncbi:hypothetical protein L1049_012708 [Liquidambar formosana]|uniref:Uncharacterized protein n=1 Tax=Liquidambar formosana TaxID=63359 RepID=A0AAP0RKH0_LIQFO